MDISANPARPSLVGRLRAAVEVKPLNLKPYEKSWLGYVYLAPGLLIYLVFIFIPILNTFRLSFHNWTGFTEPVFNGLDNYIELAGNQRFWSALFNNFFFVIFFTIIPILIGLFITSLLTRTHISGLTAYRVGLFIPQVMSTVAVGIIWRWMLNPRFGPLNVMLRSIGLEALARPWLGDFTWAPYAVGAIGAWVGYGFTMVLFVAGVQSINPELYDVARVFGANPWQEFRYVTLPGLRRQIVVAFVIRFIAAMRIFDLVYVTTEGGPGGITRVVSYELWQNAFQVNKAGYAAAMAVVLTTIILLVSFITLRIQARLAYDED
ncbi:MAG: sugar ABC transporter permease [Chloroflexi bacterium]|nr:sugar ABC transporter permease [Chloroflexota bacterium]MDL1884762.1 sugar ABC transporter permease [Anaerolineae bacterium CFX8]